MSYQRQRAHVHLAIYSMVGLEDAISMHRESLFLCPTPHPDRSSSFNNLGFALWDRFRKTGSMTDLEEAISMHHESLSFRPTPLPDHSNSLNSLATSGSFWKDRVND